MKRILISIFIAFIIFMNWPLYAATESLQIKQDKSLYVGMHIHRADAGTKWPDVNFGSWRLWDALVAWPNLEPERGRWDFSRLDRYVAIARLTHVEILLPLGLSPGWASARPSEKSSYGLGNAAEPRDMNDWRDYIRSVATRYKGRIRDYEIWNEVNEPGFFTGTPEKLVELTCEAQRILKSVSPDNRLVSPSMVGLARAPELLGVFLEKGGKSCIDIVGFHFYVPKGPPEALLPLVLRVKSVMQKAGVGHLPLWNTEAGWWIKNDDGTPTGVDPEWLNRISAAESGSWVARSLILGRAAGLERFYWYAWDNKSMGLIEPSNGAYKPGARALASVAVWLEGNATVACSTNQTRWTCQVHRQGGGEVDSEELIVWDTARQSMFSVPEGKRVWSINHLDGSTDSETTLENLRGIPISSFPVRLTLRNLK